MTSLSLRSVVSPSTSASPERRCRVTEPSFVSTEVTRTGNFTRTSGATAATALERIRVRQRDAERSVDLRG